MKSHTPIHKQLEGVFVLKFFLRNLEIPQRIIRQKIAVSSSNITGITAFKCQTVQHFRTVLIEKISTSVRP